MKFTYSVYSKSYEIYNATVAMSISNFPHIFKRFTCTCTVLSFMVEQLYSRTNVNNVEGETYRTSSSYSWIPLLS